MKRGYETRLSGTLSEWNERKACGFIDVPSMGRRVFAHKSDFEVQFDDTCAPPLGSPLSFVPGSDPKSGKERACQVQVVSVRSMQKYAQTQNPYMPKQQTPMRHLPMQQVPMQHPLYPYRQQPTHMQIQPVQQQIMQPMVGFRQQPMGHFAQQDPRGYGVLQDWNDQKACGFIEMEEGKRIFCHKSDFVEQFADGCGPPVGTPLLFVFGTDPKSFKQRAQCIEVETAQSAAEVHDERLQGTLLDWNARKGCGFIKCPDAGKNFFAHKSEFQTKWEDGEEPELGTYLSFVPGIDERSGRERAKDIQIGLLEEPEEPRSFGTLTEWKFEKGWGFIEVENPPGKRFFAHKTEFAEEFHDDDAPVGVEVSFIPGIDSKSGKERATDIRLHAQEEQEEDFVVQPPRHTGNVKRARKAW